MKAALYEGVEKLSLKDVPDPKCPPGGLLLRVHACAICGTDVKTFHHGHTLIRPPRIIGHEVSGEIVEVGQNVQTFRTGQRVAVAPAVPCGQCHFCKKGYPSMCDNLAPIGYHFDGGFAQLMSVPPVAVRTGCVNQIPEGVSFEEAAIAEPLACAINGQELSRIEAADTVLVIGAGPLGCMHAKLARLNGAARVIVADISAERLELASVAGADIYINSSTENLEETVRSATNGIGAERVIVACASGAAQEEALSVVAKRGSVNFFGGLPKGKSIINFDSNLLHYRESFVTGTHGSSPDHNRKALELIGSGKLVVRDLISKVIPLEDIIEGIKMAESGKYLKVIVKP